MINIAFINHCTKVSDAEALHVMQHLQIQLDSDFAPIWNIDAKLSFFGHGVTPPADYWWLTVLDHTDQADALGYHDLTTTGLPLGKIFAIDSVANNGNWSVTASHELMEMLIDPYIDLSVFVQASDTNGTIVAYEVCDAVQAVTYTIGCVILSNFVTPQWFQAGFTSTSATAFDFVGVLNGPLELYSGGYIGVYSAQGSGWSQVMADRTIRSNSPRMTRRVMVRADWKRSTVKTA